MKWINEWINKAKEGNPCVPGLYLVIYQGEPRLMKHVKPGLWYHQQGNQCLTPDGITAWSPCPDVPSEEKTEATPPWFADEKAPAEDERQPPQYDNECERLLSRRVCDLEKKIKHLDISLQKLDNFVCGVVEDDSEIDSRINNLEILVNRAINSKNYPSVEDDSEIDDRIGELEDKVKRLQLWNNSPLVEYPSMGSMGMGEK
jgi:hypothetical protein